MERADAARNRQAVLQATDRLLAETGPDGLSLDRVAAAAGVGKGTIFRRFGNRTGLFQALLADRAARIATAIDAAPGPLGTEAPATERLPAFLDALCGLATENLALIAAHEQACADDRFTAPTYRRWHTHVQALLAQIRPEADADFLAHVLLGCFDGELVRQMIDHGGPERLRAAVRDLTATLTE